MLLRSPNDCKYKRAWHFWKLFPRKELEYCVNQALRDKHDAGTFTDFDALAFFAAWFTARKLHLNSQQGYRRDLPWANQTFPGKPFEKIPQDIFEMWHACLRGYLPMYREYFQGSLLAARDREYSVCRITPKFLKNCIDARDAPHYFTIDEQIAPYFGSRSQAKKRMPKKKMEGLEYFSICCSNKDYFGYQGEIREETKEGDIQGKVIRRADPVCGGYYLNYIMDVGPLYSIGSTHPSKTFGVLLLLIFMCGSYLRYDNLCLITDSAYGFLDAMIYISPWGIQWVTSLREKQRKGFLGIHEFLDEYKKSEAAKAAKAKKKIKNWCQRNLVVSMLRKLQLGKKSIKTRRKEHRFFGEQQFKR